jgi:hypothetical protein
MCSACDVVPAREHRAGENGNLIRDGAFCRHNTPTILFENIDSKGGERRATATFSTLCGFDHRLVEHSIDRIEDDPGPFIRKADLPSSPADRSAGEQGKGRKGITSADAHAVGAGIPVPG